MSINAVLRVIEEYVKMNHNVERFHDIVVSVNGFNITAWGNIIDDIVKIGTFYTVEWKQLDIKN